MSTVTAPRVGVPIGTAVFNGQTVQVMPHPEYVRYFEGLLGRAGGTSGPGTIDLTVSQFEDAGIAEQQAEFFALVNAVGQYPVNQPAENDPELTNIGELHALIAELRAEVESLKQGLML